MSEAASRAPARRARAWWLAPIGTAIALVAAMCGIGGGLFAVPVLHFLRGLALRAAIATGLVLVLATALSATVTELLRPDSALQPVLVGALVAGALCGTQLGYLVGKRLSTRGLRLVFVVALSLAGLRLLLGGGGGDAASAGMQSFTLLDYALGFGIGLGGGFVSPLLGVGGGLVLVPALFLVFPSLGFAGARACSLAVAVVSATRSIWLYTREGLVQWRDALPLGLGALLGATLGVMLVHQPGWTETARIALALILWGVAVRFALELRRAGREG